MNRSDAMRALLLAAGALLAGCQSTDPVRVDEDFGRSVRSMVQNQIYDMQAAQHPAAEAPAGMDGAHGEAVLKKHREHAGNADDVSKDVEVKITH